MNRRPLLLLSCIGLAQAAPLLAAAPAPAAPSAPVPAVTYRSAFESYRSHRDEPGKDWRALNDEVGRVGGHVGIFRSTGHGSHGAAAPAAPPAAVSQPPVRGAPRAPAAAGHGH